jgi:DNA-binding CsgD family transcriptional regulator
MADAAREAGRALPLDEAVALASTAAPAVPGPTSARSAGGLSAREMEILQLLAAGHSSREIAATLVVSVRTVENHLARLYAKLGVRGRVEAVAYALRHDLVTSPDTTTGPG